MQLNQRVGLEISDKNFINLYLVFSELSIKNALFVFCDGDNSTSH